jgi:hypothetical protein
VLPGAEGVRARLLEVPKVTALEKAREVWNYLRAKYRLVNDLRLNAWFMVGATMEADDAWTREVSVLLRKRIAYALRSRDWGPWPDPEGEGATGRPGPSERFLLRRTGKRPSSSPRPTSDPAPRLGRPGRAAR